MVGARVCIAVCDPASAFALVFGYVSVGKDCAVSPWFWCSGVLPCTLVYGYFHMGKDCACLSVVLVLECIAGVVFAGYALRAVLPTVVVRPRCLASGGLDQKDRYAQ